MNKIMTAILEDTPDAKVYVNGYTIRVWLAYGRDSKPRLTIRPGDRASSDLLFAAYGESWVTATGLAIIAGEPGEMALDFCRDHGFDR